MDSTKNLKLDLKQRWFAFAAIIFDPWVLALLVLMVTFYWLSTEENAVSTKLWSVFIGLAGTVLGARIMKLFREYTEEGILFARGKSAVRSLKTLIRGIYSLEQRTDIFLKRLKKDESQELILNNFEELKTGFTLLQEETVNSIENWTDIVPGADIQSQIGMITELKGKFDDQSNDLAQLKSNFDQVKGKSKEETEALKNKIREKEREVSKLKHEITQKDLTLGVPTSIGLLGLGGKPYYDAYLSLRDEAFGKLSADQRQSTDPSRKAPPSKDKKDGSD